MASICYIDEAGCPGKLPTATSSIQPVFVISGLIIDAEHVQTLTKKYVELKRTFFPGKFSSIRHDLDALPIEIKGADLRSDIRSGSRRKRDHAFRFLDEVLALLDQFGVKVVARIWVKAIGSTFDGRAVYTVTTQRIASAFEHYLQTKKKRGIIIADFREPRANSYISHSVFTQKYRKKKNGDPFPSILEVPSFGISDNHACLQITDLLTSAIIFPVATRSFCTGYVTSVHVNGRDELIRQRYKKRLKNLQYSYKVSEQTKHGISASDPHEGRSSWQIFR